MLVYKYGDLLKSGCNVIAHQVNTFGVMGAGIALQIKQLYPITYIEYRRYCKREDILEGTIVYTKDSDFWIANCFSQIQWQTDYQLVAKVAQELYDFAKSHDYKTIGIPYKYGCGLAKGDWNIVENIFQSVFEADNKIELQIWKYEPKSSFMRCYITSHKRRMTC